MLSDYDAFKRILRGSSVTITGNEAYIYSSGVIDYFDYKFAELLLKLRLIDEDSGNWETGEVHYYLLDSFVEIRNNCRYIKMKEMEYLLPNPFYDTDRLEKVLTKLKIVEQRKAKLLKIENKCINEETVLCS